MSVADRWIARFDHLQRRRAWLAFPVAVAKKFGDDRASSLAALVAYYGFFSLFPLMLVLVTVSGIVLQGDPDLRQRIVDSALNQFPIIGSDIGRNVHAIQGDVLALVIGVVGALWAGLAVVDALQNAMNNVWGVSRDREPSFMRRKLRGVVMLITLGAAILVAAATAGMTASFGRSPVILIIGFVIAAAIDVAVCEIAFRWLTVADIRWRDVWPGALVGGVGWMILQASGGSLIARQIQGASAIYGFFAVVIGLLWWMLLSAQLFLLAAEVNVVRVRGLWPRSLAPEHLGVHP